MRIFGFIAALIIVVVGGLLGFRFWQVFEDHPAPSTETVTLTEEKRDLLERLRAEAKFAPNDYPPLGYTGAAIPRDRITATMAVDGVIDAVLAQRDGMISAEAVSDMIDRGMEAVDLLETEDRDRTAGYMIEVWYILGFRGATGHFVYGAAYPIPPGYGEPLPPGWTAHDRPRPLDRVR